MRRLLVIVPVLLAGLTSVLLAPALGASMLVVPPAATSDFSSIPSSSSTPAARWVAVSVATLWVEPDATRTVDEPALANPADPHGWIAGMTVAQKRWLVGRLETQASYGTRVYLLKTSGSWSRVAVAGQPTPRNGWGYPGWVPTVQLTDVAPALAPQKAPRMAVVRRPTLWLYETAELTGRVLELSYGTRLAAVTWTDDVVEVVELDGTHHWVSRPAVALHEPGTAWPALKGTKLVEQAKRFIGLKYLWAGTSGYGFDCSGLTHSVFQALGTTIPRDAGPQSARGKRVAARTALRLGDLIFFRNAAGVIHHVGMYVGDDRMIHAPATGQAVKITSLSVEPYASEFAGGRRFTP